ncbi:hypothetical protein GLYMA_02G226432v4 [Glycine max]|nr:hypothetical protein GLYMA_02G226432v4 [Glycine max]
MINFERAPSNISTFHLYIFIALCCLESTLQFSDANRDHHLSFHPKSISVLKFIVELFTFES